MTKKVYGIKIKQTEGDSIVSEYIHDEIFLSRLEAEEKALTIRDHVCIPLFLSSSICTLVIEFNLLGSITKEETINSEPITEPVFCAPCKYVSGKCSTGKDGEYRCTHEKNSWQENTPFSRALRFMDIEKANKNNDCRYYEEKKGHF